MSVDIFAQCLYKFINAHHGYFGKLNLFEHSEMLVFCDNTFRIGRNRTIYKLIVIFISSDQMKTIMRIQFPYIFPCENGI